MADTEKISRIKIVDERTVQISGEDHTIMNLLRWCIARNFTGEKVELVGYTIPHPSDDVSNITVQFYSDAVQSPQKVLRKIYEGLKSVEQIGERVASEVEAFENKLEEQ